MKEEQTVRWRCPACGTFNTNTAAEILSWTRPVECSGCAAEVKVGLAVNVISATVVKQGEAK